MALQYSGFEEASEDNPGGPDSLQQVLEFEEIGSEEPNEELMATLSSIANELLAEAMQAAPTSKIVP
ncbi:MAG: hypothetical protein M3220_07075 [Chloroflexota bacterium]|nr:hypothetical protein [Chloroflexota bacterium]